MKTTYYCVNAEFYDDRNVKACMTEKQADEKPYNQFKRVYGLTAFTMWVLDSVFAEYVTEGLQSGDLYIDDIISLFATLAGAGREKNNRAAYNNFQNWLNRRAA